MSFSKKFCPVFCDKTEDKLSPSHWIFITSKSFSSGMSPDVWKEKMWKQYTWTLWLWNKLIPNTVKMGWVKKLAGYNQLVISHLRHVSKFPSNSHWHRECRDLNVTLPNGPGAGKAIRTPSQYKDHEDAHVKDKTVARPSYL